MDSHDLVAARQTVRAATESLRHGIAAQEHRMIDAECEVSQALAMFEAEVGPASHGASASPAREDALRELRASRSAIRNARNALAALKAEAREAEMRAHGF